MVLFGPPGVGKGVYCKLLEKDFGINSFSTGEFSRILLEDKEHLLFTKNEIIDIERKISKGELLGDVTINKIVEPKIIEAS